MIKRIFDILFASLAILLSLPIMLLITLLIKLDSAGSIFFRQQRVGKNGKLFWIFKFRTMVEDAQKIGPSITAQSDPRVTQVGRLLRSLKLDELPQFFNVLKGEMSIVGPRPEVPNIVEKYPEEAKKIFSVKPGIVGPNQIKNIDEAAMLTERDDVEKFYLENILPQKLKNDLAYIQNKNPYKDLQFLLGGSAAIIMNSIKLRYILESRRRIMFLIIDLCLSVLSFWAGYQLRFEGNISFVDFEVMKGLIPFIIILRAPCFIYFGLYQTLWQYLGIQELIAIIKAVTVGSLLLPFVPFFIQMDMPPRSTLIIDWLLLVILLGGSRVIFKLSADRLRSTQLDNKKNVLIVGAEDAGELLVREFIKKPSLGYRPIGFIDDNPDKVGMRIHGVKVIGKVSQLSQVVKLKKADEVIIALQHASAEEVRNIIQICRQLRLACRIVPQTSAMLPQAMVPLKLRPVDVSDLLGREIIQADQAGIHDFIQDKVVLVTGAGGSIGSELVRILYQNQPREIILVDVSENNLYEIEMDLKTKVSQTLVTCYLRDVTHREEIERIFKLHRPQVIYHAAAYKHVPLVESHYGKGVINNILGTQNMADLAKEYGAECFVLISTDKAINPTSIMGTTKRIAELYVKSLGGSKTRFLSVRFGNVFNSKGSVVPLFKKQIEEGGPITITHPDVKRYFMDVSEAVFLILQATILGTDSEIFVLDMGKSIKIVDLAMNLIQMAGLSTKTIAIKYTGLRPGEKLEEELELTGELAIPTAHKKIKIWKSQPVPHAHILKEVTELVKLIHQSASREDVLQKFKTIVPEYHPYPAV
jgi:FlaA1/EpsC-like NDP-sugar epimerase/lipopolysaccharide/colanic/teichoic acid biosynthesis glycosyltransferase